MRRLGRYQPLHYAQRFNNRLYRFRFLTKPNPTKETPSPALKSGAFLCLQIRAILRAIGCRKETQSKESPRPKQREALKPRISPAGSKESPRPKQAQGMETGRGSLGAGEAKGSLGIGCYMMHKLAPCPCPLFTSNFRGFVFC